MKIKENIHIVPHYLLQPTNPISVNLIGVGGTGSVLLTALARINHALLALGHAGLMVRAFDSDNVEEANMGRQLFSYGEVGMNKAVALINRVNRFFGTAWKAFDCAYADHGDKPKPEFMANISLSCVDTVSARLVIANLLERISTQGIIGTAQCTGWTSGIAGIRDRYCCPPLVRSNSPIPKSSAQLASSRQ
jgi:PRTRC genetic system ThiF family protein